MYKKVTQVVEFLKIENFSNEYIDIILGFIGDRNFSKRQDSYYNLVRKSGKINLDNPYCFHDSILFKYAYVGDYIVKQEGTNNLVVVSKEKYNEFFGGEDD